MDPQSAGLVRTASGVAVDAAPGAGPDVEEVVCEPAPTRPVWPACGVEVPAHWLPAQPASAPAGEGVGPVWSGTARPTPAPRGWRAVWAALTAPCHLQTDPIPAPLAAAWLRLTGRATSTTAVESPGEIPAGPAWWTPTSGEASRV